MMSNKMKSSNKLPILLAVISLLLLGLSASVFAADSASGTLNTVTWAQGTMINFSLSSAQNVSNVVVSYSASNTVNSSSVVILNITNTTTTNFQFGSANITYRKNLVDTSLGSVTASLRNSTQVEIGTVSATTITIDDTNPAMTITNVPTTINSSSAGADITFTVGDATSYYVEYTGDARKSFTVTGDHATVTKTTNIVPRNGATLSIVGSDGSDSTTVSYTINLQGNVLQGVTLQGVPQGVVVTTTQGSDTTVVKKKLMIIIILVVMVFMVLLLAITIKKKTRRR